MRSLITDVEIIESRLETDVEPNYYVMRYRGRQGIYVLSVIQRYYFKDGIGFALTYTMKQGTEEEYAPYGEKIFRSFKLL